MNRSILLLGVVALVLTACATNGAGDSPSPADSGIRGTVLSGPSCPVVTAESPCPDRPWQGTVRATASDGSVAGEATTDQDGGFQLPLFPGSYVVAAVTPDGGPPTAKPQRVTVTDHTYAHVQLTVDSGIR
jgi:hypothetical protein